MAVTLEKARLEVALKVGRAIGESLEAWELLNQFDAFDDDGALNIVAAIESESAVLTMHRMRETKEDSVVLAVGNSERVRFRQFDSVKMSALPAGTPVRDLQGGITVSDWLDMIEQDPEVAFSAEGTEFIPDLARVGSLTNA